MEHSVSFIYQWITERQKPNTVYFKDNIRKIDAILVFKMSNFCTELETFLWKLKKTGMHLEFAPSTTDSNIVFGKIHAPNDVLTKYAKVYDIPLRKDQTVKFAQPEVPCKLLETLLNSPRPDPKHPVSKRAWKTISKKLPTEILFRERSVIVFAIMDYIYYGNNNVDVGIKQLIHKKIIMDAFPLHDGPWQWPDNFNEPINDRQLLAKYWASIFMVLKQQPLTIIERYFGYEIAIYFAWLGFYNKMLVYAAFMGVITFLSSVYFVYLFNVDEINLYCKSKYELCAEHTNWQRMKFSDHCTHTYISYFNSNIGTFIYSCLMIIWCTVFNELWKRELNLLDAKWDKVESEDFLLRPQFVARAKHIRRHKYTGEPELYVSIFERIIRYSCSILATMCLLCVVLSSLALIVYMESILKAKRVSRLIITVIVCFMSALFMTFLEKLIFDYVAVILTKIELPRTELDFEKSVMLKSSIYAFINNYGRLIYIGFLKGRFQIPSQTLTQICTLPGCIFEVICMMYTILLFKPFFDNFVEVQRPFFFVIMRKLSRGTINLENKPRWEREYVANPLRSVLGELEEMVIQYGLVACFAACCPLAPLFALMHNLVEIKVDSIKILKYHKRPVEKKQVTSIKVWFDIFETMTYVIIIVNAFFMAYTCNVTYVIYDYLITYKKDTFFSYYYSPKGDCYIGRMVDSCVRNSYQAGIALFLIILGFAVASILSYIIPDVPRSLREYLYHHERQRKN